MFGHIITITNYSNGLIFKPINPLERDNISSASNIDVVLCATVNVDNTLPSNDRYDLLPAFAFVATVLLIRQVFTVAQAYDKSSSISLKWISALRHYFHWMKRNYSNILFVASCFMLFVLLSPLLLVLYFIMLCYRRYIHTEIKASANESIPRLTSDERTKNE